MGSLAAVAAFFLGVVIAVVLTIALTDPIHSLMSRFLGSLVPRRPRTVRGTWLSSYEFVADGQPTLANQVMELSQVGRFVAGRCVWSDVEHRHRVRARLADKTYLTGAWQNVAETAIHHGAFQLVLRPSGEQMDGEWVGFDSDHEVRHGTWTWTRLSKKVGHPIEPDTGRLLQ